MKLKTRIHLSSTLLMLLVLLLVNAVIYLTFSNQTYSTEEDRLRAETELLVAALSRNDNIPRETVLRAYVPASGAVQVKDGAGTVMTSIQDPAITAAFPDIPGSGAGQTDVEGEPFAFVKAPIIWSDGSVMELTVAQSMAQPAANLQNLLLLLAIVTAVAMIPIFLSSRFLGKLVAQPIQELTGTMRRIQENGQFEKLPEEKVNSDELGEMTHTFNRMMELLEENYSKQEDFVSNASHELKTPLTVIRGYAKLLRRQGLRNEQVAEESLTAIEVESVRMAAMIEQLLNLAGASESKLEMKQVDVLQLLEEITAAMNTAYDRQFILEKEIADAIERTDPEKLKQILYILLDNARKYSEDRVELIISDQGGTVIQIRDYGVGIPKQSLPLVFDRFYRVDKARSRDTGGFGLGLSLAKELAERLELALEIESIEGMGTTISVRFSSKSHVHALQLEQEGSR
ncbi:cell wall metabolism sensor histidine kinase WalK [Planomicrobium sp. YIM 101495]|uniref:sensor histidine kinase n=1 Tax=Planomicrobium sp. YIM 101495 TaxID=2665160 RepID=UPI0012B71888|nr:HAMP domain-containing sensor histidine kinase [Planomicrobium sp. YIM 101495]MTD30428.1 HAMP domain-containing protein [Planomicrobium sp. YIM 101495]